MTSDLPEVDYDKIDAPRGFDITIVTTAANDEQGRAFLRAYGFPSSRRTSKYGEESSSNQAEADPEVLNACLHRCERCGRPRSVYRKFGLCRICLRQMVHAGEIPGVTKASW